MVLQDARLDVVGQCLAWATVHLIPTAEREVDVDETACAEARFRRDAEVAVGEPFDITLHYREPDKRVLCGFRQVAAIAVCPPDASIGSEQVAGDTQVIAG
jgi:hypothetical protein